MPLFISKISNQKHSLYKISTSPLEFDAYGAATHIKLKLSANDYQTVGTCIQV